MRNEKRLNELKQVKNLFNLDEDCRLSAYELRHNFARIQDAGFVWSNIFNSNFEDGDERKDTVSGISFYPTQKWMIAKNGDIICLITDDYSSGFEFVDDPDVKIFVNNAAGDIFYVAIDDMELDKYTAQYCLSHNLNELKTVPLSEAFTIIEEFEKEVKENKEYWNNQEEG